MGRPVIIFHAECADGFGGGFAAWKKFGPRARYFPQIHGNPPPKNLEGHEVYIIDFAFPAPIMHRIVKTAKRVVAIDHHKMAKASALLAHDHRFSLNHSGAVLAWEYFHPKRPIPRMLRYIEDVDLWRFALSRAKEASLAISLLPFEFRAWDHFLTRFEGTAARKAILERASIMLEYEKVLVDRLLKKAVPIRWGGKKLLAVNSPLFGSNLGNELAKRSEGRIGVVWHRSPFGIRISLRSVGKMDVAAFAARYGGGGHPRAAGVRIKKGEKLPWKHLLP